MKPPLTITVAPDGTLGFPEDLGFLPMRALLEEMRELGVASPKQYCG